MVAHTTNGGAANRQCALRYTAIDGPSPVGGTRNNSPVRDIPSGMSPSEKRGGWNRGSEDDRVCFERSFRDHYADVLAFGLRRTPDRQAAEDLAAETFAVAWRRRERIPDPALPWLYAVARRILANQRRGARRRLSLGERLAHEAAAEAPAPDLGETIHRRTEFAAAFRRLREGEREVLSLIAWEGLAPREAASVLGCSHAAFRVRLHRARRKLQKHLTASGHLAHEDRAATSDPAEEIS
jgi:RNA polymerase sigma-70 factor (ECF subfamily)